jgi:hypothetical protein
VKTKRPSLKIGTILNPFWISTLKPSSEATLFKISLITSAFGLSSVRIQMFFISREYQKSDFKAISVAYKQMGIKKLESRDNYNEYDTVRKIQSEPLVCLGTAARKSAVRRQE